MFLLWLHQQGNSWWTNYLAVFITNPISEVLITYWQEIITKAQKLITKAYRIDDYAYSYCNTNVFMLLRLISKIVTTRRVAERHIQLGLITLLKLNTLLLALLRGGLYFPIQQSIQKGSWKTAVFKNRLQLKVYFDQTFPCSIL